MRICVRVTAARTHSWMARYGSSDTAATPSIPSSRVKPIALVDARNRNRPSEASQIGTDITLAHCQHRVPHIGGAPQQKLGPFGNVRERPLPYRTHPPFLVLVQRQNAAVVRHVDVETDLDRAERIIRVLLLEPYSTMRGLEDMSVAGHDGSDVAASIKLTTMAQPAREIGRIAARKNIGSRRKENTGRAAHNHPDRADARRYDAANRSRIAIGWPSDGKGRRTGLQPIE